MAYTVLVVDDSPSAGPQLKALLEEDGYQVLTALRAEEGLDMLRHANVDLIITEALLPSMSGFDFVRHVRGDSDRGNVPILMLTVRSSAEDYATAFQAGADEYFLKPLEPPKILAAARGLITKYELKRAGAPSVPEPAQPAQIARTERGQIITVFSLKGGVGTSTIAVNLAVAIKQLAPSRRVGLIDLSLEEGLDALLLDVVPTSTIYDWAREDLRDATPYLLNQYFIQHRTGIGLLAAPTSPEHAEAVRPDVVRLTLELAPQSFHFTVVDTQSTFGENSLIALEKATTILVPITPDMAALKTAVSTLRILRALKIDEAKVEFVINEIVPRAGLNRQQVVASLGKEPHVIPHAGPDFIEASIHGTPLVSVEQPPPPARAVIDIASTLCEPEVSPDDRAKPRSSTLLGQLGRLGRTRRA